MKCFCNEIVKLSDYVSKCSTCCISKAFEAFVKNNLSSAQKLKDQKAAMWR